MAEAAAAAETPRHELWRGVGWAGFAYTIVGVQDAVAKWLTEGYSVFQLLLMRGLGAGLLLFAMILWAGWRPRWAARSDLAALRGILNVFAWLCVFTSLRYIPLAEATALFFTTPLFVALLSGPLLGEPVGRLRLAATLVGFGGAVLIVQPTAAGVDPWMLLALLGASCWSVSLIVTRKLGSLESPATVFAYSTAVFLLVGVPAIPVTWITPVGWDLLLMATIAVIGGLAQLGIILGFRAAPAVILAPLEYTCLIWALIYGWAIWGDWPNGLAMLGALVIVASGLFIVYREARVSRRQPRPLRPEGGAAEPGGPPP